MYATNADVYGAISDLVEKVWVDSICGDGVCEYNSVEYPAFGTRFGCSTDCGLYSDGKNLTQVEVAVQPVFGRNDLTTAAMQADFLARYASQSVCPPVVPAATAAGALELVLDYIDTFSSAQDEMESLLSAPLMERRRHGVLVRPATACRFEPACVRLRFAIGLAHALPTSMTRAGTRLRTSSLSRTRTSRQYSRRCCQTRNGWCGRHVFTAVISLHAMMSRAQTALSAADSAITPQRPLSSFENRLSSRPLMVASWVRSAE